MESIWPSNMARPIPVYPALLVPYQYVTPGPMSVNFNQTFPMPLHATTWFPSAFKQPYGMPMTSTQIPPLAETIRCKQEPESPPPQQRSPCGRRRPREKTLSASSSPSSSSAAVAVPRNGFASESNPEYVEFREAWLEMMRMENGGSLIVDNPRMRRHMNSSSEMSSDENYAELRARNNAASKRSRDHKKHRSHELVIQVMFLERKKAEMLEKLQKRKSCYLCKNKCPETRGFVDHEFFDGVSDV